MGLPGRLRLPARDPASGGVGAAPTASRLFAPAIGAGIGVGRVRVAIQGREKHGDGSDVLKQRLQRETLVKNQLTFALLTLFAASAAIAQPPGVPPGPPAVEIAGTVDANVVNTVDTNVVNTVDANVVNTVEANVGNTVDTYVVNTIPTDNIQGVDFLAVLPPGGTITVLSVDPLVLHAISTSIAPDTPGTTCNVSVSVIDGVELDEPIGLSALSNGQAANVSHTYDTPIGPLTTLVWDIAGSAASCSVSLSLLGEMTGVPSAAAARRSGGDQPIRIEVR